MLLENTPPLIEPFKNKPDAFVNRLQLNTPSQIGSVKEPIVIVEISKELFFIVVNAETSKTVITLSLIKLFSFI